MDNSQWLSVKDIVSKYKKFNVPSLQRTYRWGEKEITLLLNDLYEFYNTNEDNTNDFYPLQPLILKKSNKNDDTWNVLDGQQRLTTIKLIASYLEMGKDYCLDISYDTREKTKDFLDNISNKKEEDVGTSMELYYIFHAYEVIKAWFQKKEGRKFVEDKERKNAIKNVLFEKERTRFVVQEMNIDDDEAKTFQNINQGRIPLSCSELIKALFLGHIFESHNKIDNNCRFAYSSDGYGLFIPIDPIKERQSLTRLQNIIAKEWDDIETVLMHDEFYSFVCPEKDRSINRMDFLFEVVCGNEKYKKYKTDDPFNAIYERIKDDKNANIVDTISHCWNEVVKCFNRMQKLYYDFDAYHLVGFCICEDIGISEDFYKYCNEDEKLDEFKTAIRVKIKGKVLSGLKTDDLDEWLKGLRYKENKDQIKEILLLHNLQSYSDEKLRFPFNLYDGGKNYDIEHIHATAEEKADKKSRYKWFETNYSAIKRKKKELKDSKDSDDLKSFALIDLFEKSYENEKKNFDSFKDNRFNDLREIMIKDNLDNGNEKEDFLKDNNGIWNLCLLDSTTNRTYKNSLFITKREMILKKAKGEMDKEDYVYPLLLCTERIFLKFYSNVDSDDNLNFWTLNNREAYLKDISKKVTDFLKLKGEDTNG